MHFLFFCHFSVFSKFISITFEYYHQAVLVFHTLKEVSGNALSLFLLLHKQDNKLISGKFGSFPIWVKSLKYVNPSESTKLAKF